MVSPKPLRAVLFDWDGTLVDTADASYRCYERMFGDFGIAFDRDAYERTYSPDWYHTFRCVGLPQERWAAADARWLEYFAHEPIALIDGAREALDALARGGIIAGIVTSGSRPRIERELVAHDVAHHFQEVICGTDPVRRKPFPDALHLGLQRLGIASNEAAYIGDSPEDVMMARAASVFAVAVPGPYPNREALRAAGADALADDLASAIESLLG